VTRILPGDGHRFTLIGSSNLASAVNPKAPLRFVFSRPGINNRYPLECAWFHIWRVLFSHASADRHAERSVSRTLLFLSRSFSRFISLWLQLGKLVPF
jgi:hypothetical protein